jgi:hypothetical protein
LDGSGTPLISLDTNAAPALVTYTSPVLASGPHTVTFKHAGPAGTLIAIDALLITP